MRIGVLILALFLGPCLGADQIDENDLFGSTQGDIDAPKDTGVDLSPLFVSSLPKFNGTTKMSGALYAGWSQIPDATDLTKNFDAGFGYDLSGEFSFELRPDPTLRWAATVISGVPAKSANWSTPKIKTFYIDYTLADRVFFTVGSVASTWGVGRLFAVNDLVKDSATGLSAKAFAPVGPVNLTGILILPKDFVTSSELQASGQLSGQLGPVDVTLAGWYSPEAIPKIDVSVKSAWAGTDLFAEAEWVVGEGPRALAGFFWEGLTPKVRLQCEWLADASQGSWLDQSVAVGVALSELQGTGITPSGKLTQTLFDGSGQLVLGLEANPFQHIHLTLGLPICWGSTSSRWVAETISTYHEAWALALKIDLSTSF